MKKRLFNPLPYVSLLSLFGALSATVQATEITVLSAVVKDKTIPNATVTWQRNGEGSQRTQTQSNGIANQNGIRDDNETTMLISKPGYSTLVVNCPCDGFTYALSPVMNNLDGMRVVLTWGRTPSDLDSHLVYSDNHVFFKHKIGDGSNLDVDDTSSFGPETVTLQKRQIGKRYVYAVQDFSNGGRLDSKGLSKSHARVDVYVGQTRIRSYQVNNTTKGTTWVVFGIDGEGAFHDINKYLTLTSGKVAGYLNELIAQPSFENSTTISPQTISQARKYNALGEKLYHQDKREDAMYAFQNAIDLYPEFGQAYSNLGLTYQKLNRNAEALWANRKAIEIAAQSGNHVVQASSYYNIARIYEKNEDWQNALDNYLSAKALRQHSAYDKGIARMTAKLGQ